MKLSTNESENVLFFMFVRLTAEGGVSYSQRLTVQVRVVHLDVEDCSEEILCHKETARALERKIAPIALGGILLAPRWFFMA